MKEALKRHIYPFARHEPTPRDRYAGYQERVFSSTIDLACMFFLLFEPFLVLSRLIYGDQAPELIFGNMAHLSWAEMWEIYQKSDLDVLMPLNFIIQVGIIGVLLISCQYGFGTTPGRFILGLKLADAKTEEPPSLFQLIRRFLGYFISLPPLMFGYLWCVWDPKRQTWHDKIGGTVVLDARPRGWYWNQVKRLYRKLRGKPEETPPPANDA